MAELNEGRCFGGFFDGRMLASHAHGLVLFEERERETIAHNYRWGATTRAGTDAEKQMIVGLVSVTLQGWIYVE